MAHIYDSDIRLDDNGNPDVEYYIAEAKRLRAQAISELLHGLVSWLKQHLAGHHGMPLRPSH